MGPGAGLLPLASGGLAYKMSNNGLGCAAARLGLVVVPLDEITVSVAEFGTKTQDIQPRCP